MVTWSMSLDDGSRPMEKAGLTLPHLLFRWRSKQGGKNLGGLFTHCQITAALDFNKVLGIKRPLISCHDMLFLQACSLPRQLFLVAGWIEEVDTDISPRDWDHRAGFCLGFLVGKSVAHKEEPSFPNEDTSNRICHRAGFPSQHF